jgi:hypothetical protein
MFSALDVSRGLRQVQLVVGGVKTYEDTGSRRP